MSPRIEKIGTATLYLGDFREILPGLQSVDSVITDPPYSEEAHTKSRRALGKGITRCREMKNQPLPFPPLTTEERDALIVWSVEHCKGWFLAFCQAEAVGGWRDTLNDFGAQWRRAGAWIKPDSSPQLTGDRPAVGHEAIAIAWCGTGRSRWNGGGTRAIWTYGKHDAGMGHGGSANEHPTQKPRLLMEKLVSLFSDPRDIVADFFMGSGTTGVACANLGRQFIGIEKDPVYFQLACDRIAAAHAQQRMFA